MKYPMPKQLLSLLVVLTLAFTLVSTSVLAAPVSVTEENVAEKNGTGSIVVTVHNTDPGTAGSGAEISPGGDPVQGVGVNAAKVGTVAEVTTTENGSVSAQVLFGIDTSGTVNGTSILTLLGLDQDSAAARKGTVCYFSPEAVMAAVEKSSQTAIETALDGTEPGIAKAVTGADGVARFDSLSSGLYLLAKSQLPAEATTDLVPFLVSLPMYVGDHWETTVYAYPKVRTETLTLTKHAQVDNGDATYVNSGKTITCTLSTTIPATGSGQGSAQEFTDFSLTDTNTAKTLNLEESTVEVLLGGSLLTNGTDYTLSYGDSQEGTDSVLAVTLTEAGLKKLNESLSQAQTFAITYQAVLATDVSFSSSLINRAVLSYDRGNGTASAEAQETLYIQVYLPIYHGTGSQVLEQGVGHLQNTSLPVGGEGTHTVLTGHTGLAGKRLFTDLSQVKEGEAFFLHVLGETLAYRVQETAVVEPEDTSRLVVEKGKDLATLLTCYPYGINSHRLLVFGERTPFEEAAVQGERPDGQGKAERSLWQQEYRRAVVLCLGIYIPLTLSVIWVVLHRRKNKYQPKHGKT